MREGALHVVIADSALYGVYMPAHEILAELLGQAGFRQVRIEKLRSRGTRWVLTKREGSPAGLGEYHVLALRGACV